MKNTTKKQLLYLSLLPILFILLFSFSRIVHADDEENEKDDEIETDKIETTIPTPTKKTSSSTNKPTVTYIINSAPDIIVVPAAYKKDTDSDGLVDAIDPDSAIPQKQYFTDSDKDGMADLYDKYPGENDFAYVDDTDLNNNGILDSFEQL